SQVWRAPQACPPSSAPPSAASSVPFVASSDPSSQQPAGLGAGRSRASGAAAQRLSTQRGGARSQLERNEYDLRGWWRPNGSRSSAERQRSPSAARDAQRPDTRNRH